MKKNLMLAGLCLLCALLLIGCGSSTPAATPAPAETSAPAETEAPAPEASPAPSAEASVTTESPEPSAEPEAKLPDAGLVHDTEVTPSPSETLFELAKSFVDKPLSELQAEIGEPVSSSYVSSCLIPGGEDGELHYDGFTVYTVKSGDSETVQDVLAD
ncbi:MAG: hypothetical protein IJV30_04595 [Oscillospiraceae bacterium]|nr:hypothetical protein [Oscillospiraceae bacterium]